jgi:hypothetical protein
MLCPLLLYGHPNDAVINGIIAASTSAGSRRVAGGEEDRIEAHACARAGLSRAAEEGRFV